MTDIELLPLPEGVDVIFSPDGNGAALDVFTAEQVQDYARANVAHATAAKDAEIEALRAEVLRLRTDNSESFRDAAILANIRRDEAEARVERLAEALHKLEEACDDSDGAQYGTLATSFVRGICKDALRDHDQEMSNG